MFRKINLVAALVIVSLSAKAQDKTPLAYPVSGVLFENLQEAAQIAMRREEALSLLLLFGLFFVLSFQSSLEISNTLSQALRHLGNLLTAKH